MARRQDVHNYQFYLKLNFGGSKYFNKAIKKVIFKKKI